MNRLVNFLRRGIIIAGLIGVSPLNAALCVWVNPDRDIKNFFPGGDSYITETKRYSKEQGALIEQRLNAKLDPDENEFKFYRVKKQGKTVGTVLTHQARGKYGAVQTVVGLGNDDKVIGVYVQRHREPANLNKESFLKQFQGKTARDPIAVGKDIEPLADAGQSSEAVAFSVKKIVTVYDVLGK
jgi:Na+-translocating ferredoxin:NAD+ oxidoreductase RnfG subunit